MADSLPNQADEKKKFARWIQYGLFGVAGVSIGCVLLHALYPARFDQTTAMFLAVAVVALVIHQISKFKGFGIEFEKEVDKIWEDLKAIESALSVLQKDVAEVSHPPPPPPAGVVSALRSMPPIDPDDPNKGQFGGSSKNNERELVATIRPEAGPRSKRCRVTFRVISTNTSKPLRGGVDVFLHPTFRQWASYELDVKDGVAKDEIVSSGAFTIGVIADGGGTRLELDLRDVPGGTKRFYHDDDDE